MTAPSSHDQIKVLKTLRLVLFFAVVAASLFTMWTPENILNNKSFLIEKDATLPEPVEGINNSLVTDNQPNQKIGIIVGHHGFAPYGIPDPGAVCESDGLKEVDINLRIATLLKQELIQDGFTVELLDETDERLEGYEALAVISIHSDTCAYINDNATGFKVKAAPLTTHPELAERLASCIINRYAAVTGLQYHNLVTKDMAEYHAFEKFAGVTPSVIVEAGYMLLDREILTERPGTIAKGLADGIRCFAYNEPINPISTSEGD